MRFEEAKCSDTSLLQHPNSGQTSIWIQGQKLYTDMTLLGAGVSALSGVKPAYFAPHKSKWNWYTTQLVGKKQFFLSYFKLFLDLAVNKSLFYSYCRQIFCLQNQSAKTWSLNGRTIWIAGLSAGAGISSWSWPLKQQRFLC